MRNTRTDSPLVLYEDECLLAIVKPAGLHVFSSSAERDSLASRLVKSRPELRLPGNEDEPAFVHRLDAGTSGVLLAAKDAAAYEALRLQFSEHGSVHKEYLALVEGRLTECRKVDTPVGSRYRRSKRVQLLTPGRRLRGVRPAETLVKPVESTPDRTLCRVVIATGARHQIRAHLAHLGYPVVGDALYGGSKSDKEGFCLHAWKLGIVHPSTGRPLLVECALPAGCASRLERAGLGKAWTGLSDSGLTREPGRW